MNCKNCSMVIPDDVLCCPYCDTEVNDELNEINDINNSNNMNTINLNKTNSQTTEINNINTVNNGSNLTAVSNMNNGQAVQQKQESNINSNKNIEINSADDLIGKKYTFNSPWGMNMLAFFDSRIRSQVEIAKDRIFIDIHPKRKNVAPVVITEDILSIQLSKNISVYHIILAVISGVAALLNPASFLVTALCIYLGLYTKIQITQKNGVTVNMFSTDNMTAENFKRDIMRMVNIR